MDLALFFHPSRDIAMETNFGAKFADQLSFGTLASQNGLKYHNIDERIGSANYLYIVYIVGELWSANPSDYDSRDCNFLDNVKKLA